MKNTVAIIQARMGSKRLPGKMLKKLSEFSLIEWTILRIKQSNYEKAQELIKKFSLVCKTFCSKKTEIKNKLDKLMPEDEKDKN